MGVPGTGGAIRGGTRLKVAVLGGADGSGLPIGSYLTFVYDTQTMVWCSPAIAADGLVRCLPMSFWGTPPSANVFSDSTCTTRIVHASEVGPQAILPASALPAPSSVYLAVNLGTASAPAWRVFNRGAAHASTSAFLKNTQGACSATTLDPGFQYYAVGSEVAPSTFAELTPRLE